MTWEWVRIHGEHPKGMQCSRITPSCMRFQNKKGECRNYIYVRLNKKVSSVGLLIRICSCNKELLFLASQASFTNRQAITRSDEILSSRRAMSSR